MKKIGLCIAWSHENYGTTLQAFATVFALQKKNFCCEIIRYKKDCLFYLKSILRLFNPYTIESKCKSFLKKKNKILNSSYKKDNLFRSSCFTNFQKKHFDSLLSPIYKGYAKLKNGSLNYDAVLTGSDQLWIPSGLATNFYNLMFVNDRIVKISYASSFGGKKIPWYQKKRTIEYLNRIPYISVRENSGQKIVRELTKKDVPVVVDPTLLLTKEDWASQILDKDIIDQPYIFAYLLGLNKEHRRLVDELSKKMNLPIAFIPHCDHYNKADLGFGNIILHGGPEEFVNLIRHAEYVCTDSFHGTIFSVIHHKKFITFNRYSGSSTVSTNTRIDSFCENFSLSNRRYKENLYTEIIQPIDYSSVDSKVAALREKSFAYLDNALRNI